MHPFLGGFSPSYSHHRHSFQDTSQCGLRRSFGGLASRFCLLLITASHRCQLRLLGHLKPIVTRMAITEVATPTLFWTRSTTLRVDRTSTHWSTTTKAPEARASTRASEAVTKDRPAWDLSLLALSVAQVSISLPNYWTRS